MFFLSTRGVFEDLFPVENFSGTLSLEFGDYHFDEPRYSIKESKDRETTYSAPLRVEVRLLNRETGEVKEQEIFTDEYIDLLQIKTADRETPVKQLSGGNQQKVILGRWLLTHPDFLILDEPTRGIDIGTKTEIQKLIVKLASEGMSVMFISSEIEEMLRTCNRMAILRDGRKVGELEEYELSEENVMKAIAGGDTHE